MKRALHVSALVTAVALAEVLRATQPEPAIAVTLKWLNYEEKQCSGCSMQIITLDANSWAILDKECGGKRVYLKVLPRWMGEAIEVTLAAQTRKSDGTFVAGQAQSALVAKGEFKELAIEGFRYRVSASKAPEKKKEPNKSADSTPSAGTSVAEQPRVPASDASHH